MHHITFVIDQKCFPLLILILLIIFYNYTYHIPICMNVVRSVVCHGECNF